MSITKTFIGQMIKIRKYNNVSQEQLASKAKVHRTYISLLETGKRKPSLEICEKIAKALNVQIKDML